jgi:hypothetical protein
MAFASVNITLSYSLNIAGFSALCGTGVVLCCISVGAYAGSDDEKSNFGVILAINLTSIQVLK